MSGVKCMSKLDAAGPSLGDPSVRPSLAPSLLVTFSSGTGFLEGIDYLRVLFFFLNLEACRGSRSFWSRSIGSGILRSRSFGSGTLRSRSFWSWSFRSGSFWSVDLNYIIMLRKYFMTFEHHRKYLKVC